MVHFSFVLLQIARYKLTGRIFAPILAQMHTLRAGFSIPLSSSQLKPETCSSKPCNFVFSNFVFPACSAASSPQVKTVGRSAATTGTDLAAATTAAVSATATTIPTAAATTTVSTQCKSKACRALVSFHVVWYTSKRLAERHYVSSHVMLMPHSSANTHQVIIQGFTTVLS